MLSPRRYRQRWLMAPALLASILVQAGAVLAYQALRPVPRPKLFLELSGDGPGQVVITAEGAPAPLQTCNADRCRLQVEPGAVLHLVALPGEGAAFQGWFRHLGGEPNGEFECSVQGMSPEALVKRVEEGSLLDCKVAMSRTTKIEARFGLIPNEQDVALELPDSSDAETPDQPEPERIEPEKLEAPLEVALVEPPPPEVAVVPPPKPENQPPPPPEVQPPPSMTMVEVPNQNEVEKAPDDAVHLSDKNRDVTEETRAKETNLDKELEGEQAPSADSPLDDTADVGGAEETIAQLEASEATSDDRADDSDKSGQSDQAVGAVVGEEGRGGEAGAGILGMREIGGRGAITDQGDGKAKGKKGSPGLKTQLAITDYERIVGKEKAEKERQIAARRLSTKRGRREKKMAAIRSALENFTPDVRVGNQTALKTRAHPFALYVARMHRRIHELWGFGFLVDLDGKSSSHPLNDFDLFVLIEMSIDPDGSVHKTTIAKTSGKLEFDVAALDTVLQAAPYEETPQAIRSVDGRVYLRWGFYRNFRQCGTFNVESYILSEVPSGEQIDDGALLAGRPRKGKLIEKRSAQEKPTTTTPSSVKDEKAVFAANLWVSGFAQGDLDKMVKHSAVPFAAGGGVAAETLAQLKEIYVGLVAESGSLRDWALLTGDEYAAKAGSPVKLPAGALIMLLRTGTVSFALVLSPTKSGEFRVTQLVR